MRKSFIASLCDLASRDERIFLLTGDLGFGILESFRDKFSDRFLNVGVAEHNLVLVAAGLAKSGMIPFVYSIATFMSMRPYECIRSVVDLEQLPVKMIGVGAGLAYGPAGLTHHALEDISLVRTLQYTAIMNPCSPQEASSVVQALVDYHGPAYVRIERNPDQDFPTCNGESFTLGKGECLVKGETIALCASGTKTGTALDVRSLLHKKGVSASVYSFSSLHPFDTELVSKISKQYSMIAVIEEHSVIGGLGSIIKECLVDGMSSPRLRCLTFGIPKVHGMLAGTYLQNMQFCSLLPHQIAAKLLKVLNG